MLENVTNWNKKVIVYSKNDKNRRRCSSSQSKVRTEPTAKPTIKSKSLEPLNNVTWPELQNLFRQRYSKLGNTQEQLFHA